MKKNIFTQHLILRPSNQERDGEIFFQMLLDAGNEDFRTFTGVNAYGSFLFAFRAYFKHFGEYLYALFPKNEPDKFIGYAGFHKDWDFSDYENRFEVEFYVAENYRNAGYATEAMTMLLKKFFDGELIENCDKNSALRAKALSRNKASIRVLEKLGFEKWSESEVAFVSDFIDWNDKAALEEPVSEFWCFAPICTNETIVPEIGSIGKAQNFL